MEMAAQDFPQPQPQPQLGSHAELSLARDTDLQETDEWVEALQSVVKAAGPERARTCFHA